MAANITSISPNLPIPPSAVDEAPSITPTNAVRRASTISSVIENPLPQNAPGKEFSCIILVENELPNILETPL